MTELNHMKVFLCSNYFFLFKRNIFFILIWNEMKYIYLHSRKLSQPFPHQTGQGLFEHHYPANWIKYVAVKYSHRLSRNHFSWPFKLCREFAQNTAADSKICSELFHFLQVQELKMLQDSIWGVWRKALSNSTNENKTPMFNLSNIIN